MLPSGNDAAIVLSISLGILMHWKQRKPKAWHAIKKKGGLIDFDNAKDIEKKELTLMFLNHMNNNAEKIGMR